MSTNGSYPPRSSLDGRSLDSHQGAIAVALLDRHLIFRQGLESLLRLSPETSFVGSLPKPEDVDCCLNRVNVDVLILELDFPGYDMLRAIRMWSRDFPKVSLLVLSGLEESIYGERVIRAGVRGFLGKSCGFEGLLESLRKIGEGRLAVSPALEALLLSRFSSLRKQVSMHEIDVLSDRELLVLTQVGQGLSTAQIAASMEISPKTVGSFKERIKDKLGILDSQRLAQYASQQVANFDRESIEPRHKNSNNGDPGKKLHENP